MKNIQNNETSYHLWTPCRMKTLLALLLLIPSLSWAITLSESIEILLNTELEILFKWTLKGLLGIILICAIYGVAAWLMDKK